MKDSLICVDASMVIRRVIFPEHASVQQVWELWARENRSLVAPSLLFYEVTNGMYRYQRQGWLSSETVAMALSAALALPIELVGDPDLHQRARALAERFELPATYDAHYLALAERLGVELWTTDARLVSALQPYHLEWLRLAENNL